MDYQSDADVFVQSEVGKQMILALYLKNNLHVS